VITSNISIVWANWASSLAVSVAAMTRPYMPEAHFLVECQMRESVNPGQTPNPADPQSRASRSL